MMRLTRELAATPASSPGQRAAGGRRLTLVSPPVAPVESRAPESDASPAVIRSALAVAETLIPGSARIPFADEATVARAEEVVRAFDPRAVKAWRAALVALDYAAVLRKGRPLHALARAEQDALLRVWEADPVMRVPVGALAAVLKLVHFDRPTVYARMGGRASTPARPERAAFTRGIHRAAEWPAEETLECDVVVVGTGAGGAVVGRELAERGLAVVFVEEGDHQQRDAFDGSSVRAHQRFYRAAFTAGNVVMPIFVGKLVGGSTAVNTGTCFRTPQWVLDRWCEDLGTDDLSASAMRRHFERVEARIGVEPAQLDKVGPIAQLMARGCDALGWSHGPTLRNAPGCTGDGFCDFGCPSGARRSADLSYIPAAVERGAVVLTGLSADRVLVEGGRAVGITGRDRTGRTLRVRGRAVVLAGGAIPTPMFLLRQGLANSSDQVGRNLTVHPSAGLTALFDEPLDPHRHIPQGYLCDEFIRDGQMLITAQVDVNTTALLMPFSGRRMMNNLDRHEHLAQFGLMIADSAKGRVMGEVGGYPAIRYDVTGSDVRRMQSLMTRAGQMCFSAGARRVFPVTNRLSEIGSEAELREFHDASLAPSDIVWLSYHPLGTCKMGRDPRTSVVGLDHQSHDVPGLYVVDGSTVPSALGVNPQLTIMAMATRAAEGIAQAL